MSKRPVSPKKRSRARIVWKRWGDWGKVAIALLTGLFIAGLLTLQLFPTRISAQVNDIAAEDIYAPRAVRYENRNRTEALRRAVAGQVSPVFSTILGAAAVARDGVDAVFSAAEQVRTAAAQTPEQRRVADALEQGLLADPFNAPFYEDVRADAGLPPKPAQEVWEALIDSGVVVRTAAEVFLHRRAVEDAVRRVRDYLRENRQMTAAQFRDLLGTSRKYAVPLLEYLDAQRVTRRIGDYRELF